MESRFYYFAGQNPENTKISDRRHALHITKDGWEVIQKELDRDKIAKSKKEKEEAHRKYMKEGSQKLIKYLGNVKQKKDLERKQLIEQEEKIRHEKFVALKKEQEEKQREIVERAHKSIFLASGTAKMLSSAYQAGEVHHEREKQIEFKAKLKKHEEEEEAKEAEKVKQITREYEEGMKQEKYKDQQKKKERGEYLRGFMAEQARIDEEESKNNLLREENDWRAAMDEIKCMERMDKEREIKKKKDTDADLRYQLKTQSEAKHLKNIEEKELDECVQAYHDTKQRIDCLRKAREVELRNEAINRRVAATRSTFEKKAAAAAELAIKEQESLQRALAEREAEYLERQKQMQILKDKDATDKIENLKEFLIKEEERKKFEDDLLKWEKLNKIKTAEAMKKAAEEKRRKIREQKKQYGKELLQQMNEQKEAERTEIERDECITKTIAINDDENFFAMADEVMAHAKEKGRLTLPVNKAILDYRKINILEYEKPQKDDPARCEDYMEGMAGYTKNFVTKANKIRNAYRRCKCQQRE